MSAVVPVCGVLTAVVPVVAGVALGNRIGVAAWVGIALAIPAIALMSYQRSAAGRSGIRAGALRGAVAGLGFALLFIALDHAGTHAGAWPLLPGQLVSVVLVAPLAVRDMRAAGLPSRAVVGLIAVAGVISGAANLLFLAATGHGVLAIVAVLTALYPGVTLIACHGPGGDLVSDMRNRRHRGGAMNNGLKSLRHTKTILLTTYKRDGTSVATPVSVAFDGERVFFRSWHKAWKTKRLRNNPRVEVAPSTFRGKPTGPAFHARATLLSGDQAKLAAKALARRHRLLQGVVVPTAHRMMRYRTMHYELHGADT